MLKNDFRKCLRIDDLASTITWTSPLDWLLAHISLLRPVRLSFFSGLFLHLFKCLQQQAFIIELMHMGRNEISSALDLNDA